MTLIASRPVVKQGEASAAFSTPTIVQFGVVLLLSTLGSIPWKGLGILSGFWGALAIRGFLYSAVIVLRIRRQSLYRPVVSDWIFHAVLPITAFLILGCAATGVPGELHQGLFAVAGAILLLLFLGIHNAWDAVTYHLFTLSHG